MSDSSKFSFNISLSVLNHLGRNLYRSFITVLGEAISNSWDADADNVYIYVDRDNNNFVIKDDGDGMSKEDFQDKFLKIGYSKRKDNNMTSNKGRPFIGRKGIGKLALLSCSQKIHLISKKEGEEYIGGTIDNSGLDRAIREDLTPQEYILEPIHGSVFEKYVDGHVKGTIIFFENFNDGVRNSLEYLRKLIALYFRFSLLNDSFNIYLNEEIITIEHLKELSDKTEFIWKINDFADPYIKMLGELREEKTIIFTDGIHGFVASVDLPRHLKVISTDERVSVDLFVNGRLREKDILKYIPSARIAESYLYGQIHFNKLDGGGPDRFTSSREGIVADDPEFKSFMFDFKSKVLNTIIEDWDKWRIANREDGDSESPTITKKARKSLELYNAVSGQYKMPKTSPMKSNIDSWVDELSDDAQFNFASYAECFISENLIRKYINHKSIDLSKQAKEEIKKWKKKERQNKDKGNISITIRRNGNDLSYLSMDDLANLVDKKDPNKDASLSRDANEYKPIRDAIAHTSLLTDVAKTRLNSVYENIKGRLRTILMDLK